MKTTMTMMTMMINIYSNSHSSVCKHYWIAWNCRLLRKWALVWARLVLAVRISSYIYSYPPRELVDFESILAQESLENTTKSNLNIQYIILIHQVIAHSWFPIQNDTRFLNAMPSKWLADVLSFLPANTIIRFGDSIFLK